MRLLATRIPISSPISFTVLTKRAAVRSIFSCTRWAVVSIESVAQSRRLKPSVTVRISRCSISVMRTVCRISAWVYSIKTEVRNQRSEVRSQKSSGIPASDLRSLTSGLSHDFAEYEQDHENDEQAQRHEHEPQTGVVGSLFEHDS